MQDIKGSGGCEPLKSIFALFSIIAGLKKVLHIIVSTKQNILTANKAVTTILSQCIYLVFRVFAEH